MKPTYDGRERQAKLLKYKSELLKKMTKEQVKVCEALKSVSIKHMKEKGFYSHDYFYFIDVYIKKPHKICVEIDGKYHESEQQQSKDRRKDWILRNKKGFKVVRITNDKVSKMTYKEIVEYIFNNAY